MNPTEPSVRNRLLIGVLVAAALAAGLVALLSGSSAAPFDAVARAAETTAKAPGASWVMSGSMDLSGAGTFSLNGSGYVSGGFREAELKLTVGASGTALPHGLTLEERMTHGALYISSPALTAKLPGGKHWVEVDLAAIEKLTGGAPSPSSLTDAGGSAQSYLAYLKHVDGVRDLGHELIRGTATTRYAGTVNLQAVLESKLGRTADGRSLLGKMSAAGLKFAPAPVEVWIDGHGRLRRMSIDLTLSADGRGETMRMAMEMFRYGAEPAVAVPPAHEVFEAKSPLASGLTS